MTAPNINIIVIVCLLQILLGGVYECSDLLDEKRKINPVNFRPTNQLLANKFLPIWIIHVNEPDVLHREKNVMRKLGDFVMYQCPEISAAAVEFKKQHQFNGIVGSRYVINNKPVLRKSSRFFEDKNPQISELLLNSLLIKIKKGHMKIPKSHRIEGKIAYIETLVLVNYDLVEKLQTESDEFGPVVSYILTLFNNVDMLYSKLKNPIIKFNLAGIIIGTNRNSFSRLAKNCFEKVNLNGKLEEELDVNCANSFITTFCDQQKQQIPKGSYDIVVLLTSYGLHKYDYNAKASTKKLKQLGGLASSPPNEYYKLIKEGTMRPLVATISDRGKFESFPIIAHEVAHLLTVEHDSSSIGNNKIMKPSGKFNENHLSWSEDSEKHLKIFFKSPDSCMFRNEPRSLYPPGPRKMLNANKQCQCYGFGSAIIPFVDRLVRISAQDCGANLQCKDDNNGKIVEGPIFMDGTPCGINQACWNEECLPIQN